MSVSTFLRATFVKRQVEKSVRESFVLQYKDLGREVFYLIQNDSASCGRVGQTEKEPHPHPTPPILFVFSVTKFSCRVSEYGMAQVLSSNFRLSFKFSNIKSLKNQVFCAWYSGCPYQIPHKCVWEM